MVHKITWQKVGRVTEPGRYMFTFGWLTVTADDVAVWERFPDAAFTLIRMPKAADGADQSCAAEEFRLGSFNLQEPPALDEPWQDSPAALPPDPY